MSTIPIVVRFWSHLVFSIGLTCACHLCHRYYRRYLPVSPNWPNWMNICAWFRSLPTYPATIIGCHYNYYLEWLSFRRCYSHRSFVISDVSLCRHPISTYFDSFSDNSDDGTEFDAVIMWMCQHLVANLHLDVCICKLRLSMDGRKRWREPRKKRDRKRQRMKETEWTGGGREKKTNKQTHLIQEK